MLLASVCLPNFGATVRDVLSEPETTEIVVPYHVVTDNETLLGICRRLGDEYGDRRDSREIAYQVCADNNKKDGWVYIGEKINVRLHVPVETK